MTGSGVDSASRLDRLVADDRVRVFAVGLALSPIPALITGFAVWRAVGMFLAFTVVALVLFAVADRVDA